MIYVGIALIVISLIGLKLTPKVHEHLWVYVKHKDGTGHRICIGKGCNDKEILSKEYMDTLDE